MLRQRGAILQVGEVVYVDDGNRRLAVFGNCDRPVPVPGLGHQLPQMRPCRCQAVTVTHPAKGTLCSPILAGLACGSERSNPLSYIDVSIINVSNVNVTNFRRLKRAATALAARPLRLTPRLL